MMSLKKMVEMYAKYKLDEETWKMLYSMACHELISRDTWNKFFDKCSCWHMSEDAMTILDGDEKPVYTFDESGYLVKVA